jgi:hypothetical protein
MNKKLLIFLILFIVPCLIAFFAYEKLEIYDKKEIIFPSQTVYNNRFYAMERWLNETGHPVRVEKEINPEKISLINEKIIVIDSMTFNWKNSEKLILWIEQGGYLIIYLNIYNKYINYEVLDFLNMFGIDIDEDYSDNFFLDNNIPDFAMEINFLFEDEENLLTIKDDQGLIRLAEIPIGNGSLTVTDSILFMHNGGLEKEINASLAWNLTGARANGDKNGVLFVRDKYISKSLLGKIFERGNLIPAGISLFFVIILGFWMVIPVFGKVYSEKQKIARPIRDRFIAEIRFLKKYKSLDHYLIEYEPNQEIEKKQKEKKYNYRKLINQYRRMYDDPAKF